MDFYMIRKLAENKFCMKNAVQSKIPIQIDF